MEARKNKRDFNSQLNEFGIDVESCVTVEVIECYGMPRAEYVVQVRVADKCHETQQSAVTDAPKWDEKFELYQFGIEGSPVWSPHSHVIVTMW